jgi:hypothetical protein
MYTQECLAHDLYEDEVPKSWRECGAICTHKHENISGTCVTHLRFPSTDGGRLELHHCATDHAGSSLATEIYQCSAGRYINTGLSQFTNVTVDTMTKRR